MPEVTSHPPGTFCWGELTTRDPEAAKRFYSALFGWRWRDDPLPGGGIYTMLELRGRPVSALYKMLREQEERAVPPHWMTYVSVANVDDAVEKAAALGARVLAPPFDVLDAGRMTVLADPIGGAIFAAWQPRKHIGAEIVREPGALCWHELSTPDVDGAKRFYGTLFGWTTAEIAPQRYTEIKIGGRSVGGMLQMADALKGLPSTWLPYFAADDCHEVATRARTLGGTELVPSTALPSGARYAVLRDPTEAIFALYQRPRPAPSRG